MVKNFLLGLAFAALLSNWSCAQTIQDIYLAVRHDGNPGTGQLYDPYDAGTADKYDRILQTYSHDTAFHYSPGTYQTTGWHYLTRHSAGVNCKHYGANMDQTIIQLVGASDPTQDGVIFSADCWSITDGFEVHDMTLDCNANGNPKFTQGMGAVMAIGLCGSNILVQNVKFINFGTSRSGAECFVVLVSPSPQMNWRTFTNIQLNGCVFTSPATGNRDGMDCAIIGSPAGVTVTNTVVQNCWFLNVASDFLYSNAFFAQQCVGNYVQGCGTGTYLEPVSPNHNPWVVENNTFSDVAVAALITFHATGEVDNLTFNNNTVILRNLQSVQSRAVTIEEPSETVTGTRPELVNLTIVGNSIYAAQSTATFNNAYSGFVISSPNQKYFVGNLTITNNQFSAGTSKNGQQILIMNAANFILQSQISNNTYFDGSAAVPASLSPN